MVAPPSLRELHELVRGSALYTDADKFYLRDLFDSIDKSFDAMLCVAWNWRHYRAATRKAAEVPLAATALADPYIALGRHVAIYEDFASSLYRSPRILAASFHKVLGF